MAVETAEALGEMVAGSPAPALRGDVLSYTGYSERTAAPLRRLEVATARIPLILSLGPSILVDDVRHTSFVAGLDDSATVTEHAGDQLGIQVDLPPLGARRLLGMPMAELTRRVVGLEDLVGPAAAELLERLHGLASWPERYGLLDAVLAARLEHAAPIAPELHLAWERIARSGGTVGIERLAAEVGWSRRRLAARFGSEVGMTPKALARIVRFERVADLLRGGHVVSLADAAYACGYADQAHLNRDFRAFASTTPTNFSARVMRGGAGVAA